MSREKLTSATSRELCTSLRQGLHHAFVVLYNHCEPIVVPIVRTNYKGRDLDGDIDETIQETILRVYKVIGITNDYDEAIDNFMGLVALGKWRDQMRKRGVYQKHLDGYAEQKTKLEASEDDELIRQQFNSLMDITAKELPRCHPLFILCYEFDLPITEIAKELNTSANNISSKLNYCRKRLLEKLKS